ATARSTSRTACRPPKRRPTPRKRRAGSAIGVSTGASVKRLLDQLLRDLSVDDCLDLPLPRGLDLLARRLRPPRGRARRLEQAAEGLVYRRHVRDDRRAHAAARLLHELELVLDLDRLIARVELRQTAVRDPEGLVKRPRHRP